MKRLTLYAVAAAIAFASPVVAATVDTCGNVNPDVTNNVLNNEGCFVFDGFANLDSDIVIEGNDLDFIEKDDGAFGGGTELVLSGDSKTGTWEITNFVADTDYLLVFKDGTTALPSNQVGYLVREASGTYDSPFYNDADGTSQKDISFVSLFIVTGDGPIRTPRTDPPAPVPLPASILLLGGAIGLTAASRKLRRSV